MSPLRKTSEQSEWREGLKLSQYLRMAIRDVRRALATGRYQLYGELWHEPADAACERCSICLAGGIMAAQNGYDASVLIEDNDGEEWEFHVFHLLDGIRTGGLPSYIPNHLCQKVKKVVEDHWVFEKGVASLEAYEQVACFLEKEGF